MGRREFALIGRGYPDRSVRHELLPGSRDSSAPPAKLLPRPVVALRVSGAVARLNLVESVGPGPVSLTELGQLLRRDHPKSIRDLMLLATDPTTVGAWGNLDAAIRTGRSGFENAYGRSYFDYLTGERELSTTYHRAMGQLIRRIAETVPSYNHFTGATSPGRPGGDDARHRWRRRNAADLGVAVLSADPTRPRRQLRPRRRPYAVPIDGGCHPAAGVNR